MARLLGETAELYTRHLLLNFKRQAVDSQVFSINEGKIELPEFSSVEHRSGLVIQGDMVEFDLTARGDEEWLIEVKYWTKPVSVTEVDKFIAKLQKLDGWHVPLLPGKQIWFFSKNGFQDNAKTRLQELKIRHSDIFGFNELCRAVRIGEVPVTL